MEAHQLGVLLEGLAALAEAWEQAGAEAERLDIAEILSLGSDFDVDRRVRREPFRRVPLA